MLIVSAGRITRIAINRPEKVNALNSELAHALANEVRNVGKSNEAALVVLSGRGGKGFCAGADIAEFAGGERALESLALGLVDLAEALSQCPTPILSIIHGRTLGAGGMVAVLSDLVIASDDLIFGFPEIRFLMHPVLMQTALLERLTPTQSWQLSATGRLLSAAEAQAWGIVSEILPAEEFERRTEERVHFYGERAPVLSLARKAIPAHNEPPVHVRMAALIPMMIENLNHPGVLASIRMHLPRRRDVGDLHQANNGICAGL